MQAAAHAMTSIRITPVPLWQPAAALAIGLRERPPSKCLDQALNGISA